MTGRCAYCATASEPVPCVAALAKLPRGPVQGSEAWLEQRAFAVTGSDVASVCHRNFLSPAKVTMMRKIQRLIGVENVPEEDRVEEFKGNDATRWGQKYEPEAMAEYVKRTGHRMVDPPFNLVMHPDHASGEMPLGASPDGVTWCGRLVEIKCPYTRAIPKNGKAPSYYLDQMQCQMVCLRGITQCDFVQYRPPDFVVDREAKQPVRRPFTPMTYTQYVVDLDPNWETDNAVLVVNFLTEMRRRVAGYLLGCLVDPSSLSSLSSKAAQRSACDGPSTDAAAQCIRSERSQAATSTEATSEDGIIIVTK